MKVSIITVVLNGKETLREAIRSVVSQTYPNIEYIIVDGGSTDGTLNIIQSFGERITRWISEPDKGIYDAMNKGLQITTGDIVGILNADDCYAHNDVISNVVDSMMREDVHAVYGDLIYLNKKSESVLRYWKSGSYRPGYFRLGWMPPHPTFFVKKEIYQEYGLFDTRLSSAADYELMLRFIHKFKIKVSYIPEVLVRMKAGGKSNASLISRLKANKEDREAWKLNGYTSFIHTTSLKPLRKLPQYFIKPAELIYKTLETKMAKSISKDLNPDEEKVVLN